MNATTLILSTDKHAYLEVAYTQIAPFNLTTLRIINIPFFMDGVGGTAEALLVLHRTRCTLVFGLFSYFNIALEFRR
jgi:hypothetical protein